MHITRRYHRPYRPYQTKGINDQAWDGNELIILTYWKNTADPNVIYWYLQHSIVCHCRTDDDNSILLSLENHIDQPAQHPVNPVHGKHHPLYLFSPTAMASCSCMYLAVEARSNFTRWTWNRRETACFGNSSYVSLLTLFSWIMQIRPFLCFDTPPPMLIRLLEEKIILSIYWNWQ